MSEAPLPPAHAAPTPGPWRMAWALLRDTVNAWSDDGAPSMGAALSYYTVFSMAPLLLIVIGIAGALFGADAARGEIFGELSTLMGPDAAKAIESLLADARRPQEGMLATAIGITMALVGATTVFGELQGSLDRIWRISDGKPSKASWTWLRTRLLSVSMIGCIAFLLMVSLVMGALISALGKWWGAWFGLSPHWEAIAQSVNLAIGFGLTTLVFAMIYKLLPRRRLRWSDVWLGALVTSVLFTVGKFLIGLYIGKSGVASGFGAAGSLIVVFVWVYYSAQIYLLGAEFTAVYARTLGSLSEAAAPRPASAPPTKHSAMLPPDM